jgi:thiol:disulfide interchange protein
MLSRSALLVVVALTTAALGCGAAREPMTVTIERHAAARPALLEIVGSGTSDAKRPPRSRIEWMDASNEASARDRAARERRGVLVYFSATWCMACVELEKTFRDPRVVELTTELESIQVDATNDDDPQVLELTTKYRVVGLPTLVLFDSRGFEVARITKYVTGPELAMVLEKARP